jgi:hypothetical protein
MSALRSLRSTALAAARGVEEWFFAPADPRAYAALRIGYGACALFVLVDLWPVRVALFGENGMFGGAVRAGFPPLDVFAYARSDAAVTAVFVFVALAAAALALGVWQRAAALVVYAWAASYTMAAPVAQSGFDTILRVVGFAVAVSPTVTTWSVRPARACSAPPAYGLRMVQWQVLLIYACTAWLKAPDPFWRDGEAISYFWMSMFSRFPSPVFAHYGVLGAVLTYSTLLIELALPFLLWVRKTRYLGIFLGVSLHFGIALTSKLALFSLAVTSLYVAFLEQHDFDRFAAWLGRRPAPAEGAAQSLPVRTTQ